MRALLATLFAASVLAPSNAARDLHPAVREALADKMQAHAAEMTDLVMLVVLLERDDAAQVADRIAAEPRIGCTLEEADLDVGVPEPFYRLQQQLSWRANAVATAARAGDDAAMSRAFGELAATCVACHATYLDSVN